MSKVAVQKFSPADSTLSPRVTDIFEHIRQRAFDLFDQRGRTAGKDIDDWLNAEREMIFVPPSELVEEDMSIELRVAAPGFRADQLSVRASPGIIIVEGKADSKQERKEGKICFSELSRRDLLRQFIMPKEIDPEQVSASLQEGIVTIVANKATAVLPKPMASETAGQQKGKTSVA